MAKAVRKIEQLQLPLAPSVDAFLTSLRKLKEKPETTSTVYHPHEAPTFMSEFFDDEELEGYSVSFACAWKCLSYFLEVIDTLDYKFATVDDFFLSWARCVLSVHALKEKEEDKVHIMEYRKQLGVALQPEGRKIKTYDLAQKSIVNYVNAVMNIYNSKSSAKLYPNLKFTLPRYFRFGLEAVTHYRDVRRDTSSGTLYCYIWSGYNIPLDVTLIPLDVSRILYIYRNIIGAIRRK